MTDKLATGFRCTCGKAHRFPPYVYSHAREVLRMKCEECRRPWTVIQCRAMPSKYRRDDPVRFEHFFDETPFEETTDDDADTRQETER